MSTKYYLRVGACQPAPGLICLLRPNTTSINSQALFLVAVQWQIFILRRRMSSSNHGHAPTAVMMGEGVAGKANSLARRSSHQKPHTSNSPGRPTLPLSPSSWWVTCLHPGILAKITHQVRHQRDERPAQTTAALVPTTNYPPTPANIRPRCACRSFKLVGACLVLTFLGTRPMGNGSSLDPWYRSSICEHARTPWTRFRPILS